MEVNKSVRLLELDALRGIACMSVVLFHLGVKCQAELGNSEIFNFGITGVELFFVISGFVILMTLEKTKSWKDFLVSRASRLYPAYWACASFTALLYLIIERVKPDLARNDLPIEYLINLTMLQKWVNIRDLDSSYWTLSVELIFYGLMLIAFRANQIKNIEAIGLISLIAIIATQKIAIHPIVAEVLNVSKLESFIVFYPLFYAGIITYKMKFNRTTITRYTLIIICFATQYLLFSKNRTEYISSQQYGLILILYGIILFLFVNDFLGFIVNKTTIFLGEISYSLYLIHQFLAQNIIIPGLTKYNNVNPLVATFIVALPICIVIATIINKKIEKPMMLAIRAFYRSRKAA
jgi:peptidoglycan/LPS O-acetylase OafA/YrhL